MNRLQVLHCAEMIKGGTASYLRELIKLQRRDFGPDAVMAIVPASQSGELPQYEGVRIAPYDDRSGRALNALKLARQAYAMVKKHQPAVVHIHGTFGGAAIRPLLRLCKPRPRIIYCPHGWAFDRSSMSPRTKNTVRRIERALSFMTDHVICISQHEYRVAADAGIAAKRLSVVVNGVAAERPLAQGDAPQWRADAKRLLFVGRFDKQKGVDVFFEALRCLGDEAHALVAGDAILADENRLDPPPNATLVGWLNSAQLERLFESADALVMPSRWEGFGLIAAEAMRAGIAVIASKVGGLPEVVDDGVTGVLVEPDNVEALVDAIRQHDRATLRAMGMAGQQRFRAHFTTERLHAEMTAVYGMSASRKSVSDRFANA